MADKADELLKRPLYVFDLPHELLLTLQLKDSSSLPFRSVDEAIQTPLPDEPPTPSAHNDDDTKGTTSCHLCHTSFSQLSEQRRHVKSDWHGYNLKQKLRGLPNVNEVDFEKMVGELDESISGSDSSSEEEEEQGKGGTLAALLKRQAKLQSHNEEETISVRRANGAGNSPLAWFSSTLLPTNTSLGIYKAFFTAAEQQDAGLVDVLRKKQLKPIKAQTSQIRNDGISPLNTSNPTVFLCMIGGGHFAAMIVSLAPKVGKSASGLEERQAIVLSHKTFHRYTTRKKQGGSQSANDSAKGAAHSAGAGIRRYNEVALESEVRALLAEWRTMIDKVDLLFVRATGTTNRRTLFGPYDGQVLRANDPRNRSIPFSTKRATQAELMRAFVELTRVKVSRIDEAALAAAAAAEVTKKEESASKHAPAAHKITPSKPSKDEEAALLHTSQLQALIRRSRGPAIVSYLSHNLLSPDFVFHPPSSHAHHHASTPLHLAASTNVPVVVIALLTKAGANPTILNGEGKPPFDIAGDRATRDAFRIARLQLGEDKWNWDAARCPPPMTKAEAEARDEAERGESEKAETARRKAETERLEKEAQEKPISNKTGKAGKTLGVLEMTGSERREQEGRGLTPEMRVKLERERRARAAEERMKRMGGGNGSGAGR